jgi:hypothetical protein
VALIGLLVIIGLAFIIYKNSAYADINAKNYCSNSITSAQPQRLSQNSKYNFGNNTVEYIFVPKIYESIKALKNTDNNNPEQVSLIISEKELSKKGFGGKVETTLHFGNPTGKSFSIKNPEIIWRQGSDKESKIQLTNNTVVLNPGEYISKSFNEEYTDYNERIYPKTISQFKLNNTWYGPYEVGCLVNYISIAKIFSRSKVNYNYKQISLFNFNTRVFSDLIFSNLVLTKKENIANNTFEYHNPLLTNDFSSVSEGKIIVPESKNYTFQTNSTKNIKVLINGNVVYENTNKYKTISVGQFSAKLLKNKANTIKIEFTNYGVEPVLKLNIIN